MQAEYTSYAVPGWGAGELWTWDGVVLASEFNYGRDGDEGAAGPARELVELIEAFLAGEDVRLDEVPLDLSGLTEFEERVVTRMRAIPRGEVVSYSELAALVGHPNAQRAVGTVCAKNRFALFVPCHRVVGVDGIGSYGSAGVGVKRRLLAIEGVTIP